MCYIEAVLDGQATILLIALYTFSEFSAMKRISRSLSLSSIVLASFLCTQGTFSQTVWINEFMASNSKTIADPDYKEYGDWVELYNSGDAAVNLKGYSITDLFSQPQKFVFQIDLIIQPKGFLLIWTDDKAVGAHANFKLSASGESIGLFSPSGQVVDSLSFGAQQNDISSGRYPDGSTQWYKFSPASPGAPNLEANVVDRLASPTPSSKSGFYTSPIVVTLTHPVADAVIRFTLDGHTPTSTSSIYSKAISIDSTMVVRAKAFKDGFLPSAVLTSTFLINEKTVLPVFSLVTDPENFFSDSSGIYVEGKNGIIDHCSTAPRNWNQDWERPVDLELFERDHQSAFAVSTGVKIFGGCARLYPEKSLAFYFRQEYGYDKLHYRLFSDLPITEYNNFLLRSSGQDWWRTMFRDGMVQTLIKQGMKTGYQDYRPSILFINGQYWGIHNIREKLNEHYVESHFGVSSENVDFIDLSKGVTANSGDTIAYKAMINFLTVNSLTISANYEYIKSIVDIDNYLDYQIAEIYGANGDWPGSNMKMWRERSSAGKWRWMISDMDFTFGGNTEGQYTTNTLTQATATNGPSWPNPPWSTLMLRKMLENTEFKNEFIQRFAAHMNMTFEVTHVVNVIDSLAAGIASEIPRHKARWPQSLSMGPSPITWTGNVQVMRDFAANRAAAMRGFIITKFSITGSSTLTLRLNDSTRGKLFVHGIEIRNFSLQQLFFRNIPVKIRALALPGFRFAGWQGASTSTSPEISLILSSDTTLTAVFEPATLSVTTPVINEINYKSSPLFDTEDWIELYNPASSTVNLAGWKFRDDSAHVYTFPANTFLPGRSYLVLCRDTVKFFSLQFGVRPVVGNFGFGLRNEGETIQLIDSAGTIADEVHYMPSGQWPVAPNGTGATLALLNPQMDNSQPEQWRASAAYGTPGALNDIYSRVAETPNPTPQSFELFNNYPNPFNPTTTIRFYLPERSQATLTVYNQLGQKVRLLVDAFLNEGMHTAVFTAENAASGIYFCELMTPTFRSLKKFVLVK